MTGHAAVMQLSIDAGSDPISGSLSVDAGAPEQFCGWIELVAAIEALRHTASVGERGVPVSNGGGSAYRSTK